jgi:hypothetical protein
MVALRQRITSRGKAIHLICPWPVSASTAPAGPVLSSDVTGQPGPAVGRMPLLPRTCSRTNRAQLGSSGPHSLGRIRALVQSKNTARHCRTELGATPTNTGHGAFRFPCPKNVGGSSPPPRTAWNPLRFRPGLTPVPETGDNHNRRLSRATGYPRGGKARTMRRVGPCLRSHQLKEQ